MIQCTCTLSTSQGRVVQIISILSGTGISRPHGSTVISEEHSITAASRVGGALKRGGWEGWQFFVPGIRVSFLPLYVSLSLHLLCLYCQFALFFGPQRARVFLAQYSPLPPVTPYSFYIIFMFFLYSLEIDMPSHVIVQDEQSLAHGSSITIHIPCS